MHERMTFPWEVEEASLRTTTVAGVHGINCLERYDAEARFESDEEAQEHVRMVLEYHDELVKALQGLVHTADTYWTPVKSTQWPALDEARAVLEKVGKSC
jgi:hypothetical protein